MARTSTQSSPLRVLIIDENLPVPLDRRVWQESLALHDEGYDVTVVAPAGPGQALTEELEGVHVLRYPLTPARGGLHALASEYLTALAGSVRVSKRRGPFDVVHICNPPDLLFLVALPHRLRGASLVYDQHDLVPELCLSRGGRGERMMYGAARVLERITYALADVVITTNVSARQMAVSRGGKRSDRVYVVRNAPDLSRFRPVSPAPELKLGHAHLLFYAGMMGPQDGVDHALRALALLRGGLGVADWHAIFAGDGEVVPDLITLAGRLGLDDAVSFPGMLRDEELRRHLATADVCLAPEPLNPLNAVSTMAKNIEYMTFGRPIVAFDLPETRFTAGRAAVYAPPNDEGEFARAIASLLDNASERAARGAFGRERARGALSWEHSRESLLDAYRAAVGVRRNGRTSAPVRPMKTPRRSVRRRELRVLHVGNGNDYSGIARVMDLLGRRLPDQGVQLGFACLRLDKFAELRESSDVPLYDIPMNGRGDVSVVRRLASVAREDGYDLIHTHGPRAGLVGSGGALAARLPLVHHLHGCTLTVWSSRARNLVNVAIERAALARAAGVVVVSEDLRRYLRRQGVPAARLFVVPNGVPPTAEPGPWQSPPATWTLGTVARFRSVKGTTVLLRALAELRGRGVDLRFRGIGEFESPAHRAALDALALRLGVMDLVEWRGFRHDVHAELAALDIFVLPSFSEGMPMSVIEAMATGVPVVASRVGGVPELVRDGIDGLLVPPGDPLALADAIARLVNGSVDAQALRSSAYLRQRELYTDDAMATALAAVYRKVLGSERVEDPTVDSDASAVAG